MTSPSTIKEKVSVIINTVPRLQADVFGNEWPPHPHSAHTLLNADDHLQYMLCTAGADRPFIGDVYVDAGFDLRAVSTLRLDDANRAAYSLHQPTEWTLDHIKLSTTEAEWESFYDRFGVVSLLGAMSAAYDSTGVETIEVDGGLTVTDAVVFYPGANMIITRTEAGDGFRFDALTGEISYEPTAVSVDTGTLVSGNLASIVTPDDSNVLTVDEVTGAPGFAVTVTVAGVDNFDRIVFRAWYDSPAVTAHNVSGQVWRVDTASWETQGTFTISETYQVIQYQFPSDTNYIDGSGNVKVRFYHPASGVVGHVFYLDYVEAIRSVASGAIITDHGALSGLTDDDHSQYILVNGTRAFTGDQSMGSHALTNVLYFDMVPDGVTRAEARLWWDDDEGCLSIGMKGGATTLQVGKEMVEWGTNSTGSTITNGRLMYISSATGDVPHWSPVDATNMPDTCFFALSTEEILNGAKGYGSYRGLVRGLNTSFYGGAVGDSYWLSPITTSGNLTAVMPAAPNPAVCVGTVVHAGSATDGAIHVNPYRVPRLSYLEDVNVRATAPADHDVLLWDGANSRWDLGSALGFLPETAVAFGDANDLVTGDIARLAFDSTLFWGGGPLNHDLLSLGSAGIGSVSATILGGTGDYLTFTDSNISGSGYSYTAIPFSKTGEIATAVSTFSSTSSVIGMLIAAAGMGGGSLQDAYEAGRTITMDSTYVGPVVVNSGTEASPCLTLTQTQTTLNSAVMTLTNAATWDADTSSAPYAISFTGDAGLGEDGAVEENALGHRLWTSNYLSMGRTNSAGFSAWFSATEGNISNPDGRRARARLAAYAFDNVSGLRERNAYVNVQGSGVSGGLSFASIAMYADDSIGIESTAISMDGMQYASYGAPTEVTPASGVATFVLTGKQYQFCDFSANITKVELTAPVGSMDVRLTFRNEGASAYTVTNFVITGTATACVTWMDLDIDSTPISVPAGYILEVHLVYDYTATSYRGWASVSTGAEV